MTKDVIAMAREAGIEDANFVTPHPGVVKQLERFATLVRNATLDEALHIIARHPTDSTRNEIMEAIESLKEPTT